MPETDEKDKIDFNYEDEGHFHAIVPTALLAIACHAISALTWMDGVKVYSNLKNGDLETPPDTFHLQWTPADKEGVQKFREMMKQLGAHEIGHGKRYKKK